MGNRGRENLARETDRHAMNGKDIGRCFGAIAVLHLELFALLAASLNPMSTAILSLVVLFFMMLVIAPGLA